jgi:hypothetical protein
MPPNKLGISIGSVQKTLITPEKVANYLEKLKLLILIKVKLIIAISYHLFVHWLNGLFVSYKCFYQFNSELIKNNKDKM